jgi:hypothetical protein
LIAIQLEERDLLAAHGAYAEYRRQVPMLVPRFFAKKKMMPQQAAQEVMHKTAA